MNTNNTYDVIVMGGGPAGSSVAGILAREGRKVILFEKEDISASSHRRIVDD